MIGILGMFVSAVITAGQGVYHTNGKLNDEKMLKQRGGFSNGTYLDYNGKHRDIHTKREVYTMTEESTRHRLVYDRKTNILIRDITAEKNIKEIRRYYDAGFRIFATPYTFLGEEYKVKEYTFIERRKPLPYYNVFFKDDGSFWYDKKYYVINNYGSNCLYDPEKQTVLGYTDSQKISCVKCDRESIAWRISRGMTYSIPNRKTEEKKAIDELNKKIKERIMYHKAIGDYRDNWIETDDTFTFETSGEILDRLVDPDDYKFLSVWEEYYK